LRSDVLPNSQRAGEDWITPLLRLGAEAALAKVQATRCFEHCAREAAHLQGGNSYVKGNRIESLCKAWSGGESEGVCVCGGGGVTGGGACVARVEKWSRWKPEIFTHKSRSHTNHTHTYITSLHSLDSLPPPLFWLLCSIADRHVISLAIPGGAEDVMLDAAARLSLKGRL